MTDVDKASLDAWVLRLILEAKQRKYFLDFQFRYESGCPVKATTFDFAASLERLYKQHPFIKKKESSPHLFYADTVSLYELWKARVVEFPYSTSTDYISCLEYAGMI